MVAADLDKVEVDRLCNLLLGWGWKITKQEYTTDKIIIEIEKEREFTTVEADRLEVDRAGNLIQGFGWTIAKQEYPTGGIILTVERSRVGGGEIPEAGPA